MSARASNGPSKGPSIIQKIVSRLNLKEPETKDREKDCQFLSPSHPLVVTTFSPAAQSTVPGAPKVPPTAVNEFVKCVNQAAIMDSNIIFQPFNPYHNQLAQPLFKLFYQIDLARLPEIIDLAKLYVNKYLLHYVLSLAIRHRPDLKGSVSVPAHVTVAPHLYFDMGNLGISERVNRTITLTGKFNYDHEGLDLEQRVEYFRLDPGLNTHHRHWHEAYLDAPGYTEGDEKKLSRPGELFYYMHSQMVARYNFERVSVKIPHVQTFNDFRDPLPEPYFNKLTTETGEKLWDSRPPNQKLGDVNTRGVQMKIQDIELWRDRIYEAIDHGSVFRKTKDGKEVLEPLNGVGENQKPNYILPVDYGIDKLGTMIWAFRNLSPNFGYYGNLHNSGHIIIGYSHDPEGQYYKQSQGGAMTMPSTATRDPAFFRWHAFIDDLFQRYKATLPEYKVKEELEFEGIKIQDITITTRNEKRPNILKTNWAKDKVDITDGVSEGLRKLLDVDRVNYEFIHLAHQDFQYKITVNSAYSGTISGTFRIFIAPVYEDEKYKEQLFSMSEKERQQATARNPYFEPSFNKYRRTFVELDKFVKELNYGKNVIIRSSQQSSVTIPFKQLFMTTEEAIKYSETEKGIGQREVLSWCGCGWPDYLLIGRGAKEGLLCRVFVMVSEYRKDRVRDWESNNLDQNCGGSLSYCGVRDKEYPDRKPMGYPFDRNMALDDYLLKDFMTKTRDLNSGDESQYIGNMKFVEVTIEHSSVTENGRTLSE